MKRSDYKLYVAAGMIRSGSTWLFNAIRLALLKHHSEVCSCWIDDFNESEIQNGVSALVKIHGINSELASKATEIFTCHRDIRDVAVSLLDMNWASSEADACVRVSQAIEQYEFWRPRSSLDVKYDDILAKPVEVASSILAVLYQQEPSGFKPSWAEEIVTEINSLRLPEKNARFDPTTLLHVGHRSSGRSRWQERLSAQTISMITRKHGKWLSSKGYA